MLSGLLPKADVVWSYGVLHHTGNLSLAVKNVARLVRPEGLLKIELHTSEELPFLDEWLDFKRDWASRPNWYKEEALIAYVFSELWDEMQEKVQMEELEARFGEMAHLPGFFRRFEAVRHVLHHRFWAYTKGRGMDFVTDAVDWLGGHPYEMWRTTAVLDALADADPPLKALHATFAGFVGLLLTPAPRSLGWMEASQRTLARLQGQVLREPGALWHRKRRLMTLNSRAISIFSRFVLDHCGKFLDGVAEDALPSLRVVCEEWFQAQILGNACWIAFFGAKGTTQQDMPLFHLLEDGQINGWGAPNMSLCLHDSGASYRFFTDGILLFTVRDGSDPRSNGHSYQILSPD
mmetsp:Transcript_98992/g.308505  ORF Transcript_98992/g.308505 Transcript_98992/m.308505 type:complete len:349 (-) Transcript_98992:11-1057(-)